MHDKDKVILTWSLQTSGIKESIAKVDIPAQQVETIAEPASFLEPPSNPNSADEVRATEQAEQELENFMLGEIANVAATFSMQSPAVVYQPDVPDVPSQSQPQRQSQGQSMAESSGKGKDMQTLRNTLKGSSSRASNFQPRTLRSQMQP